MDLQSQLIESSTDKKRGKGLKASLASVGVHALIIGSVFYMSTAAASKIADEKPIKAYLSQGAAPPPPPPPPPPPAASSAPKSTPKPVQVKPVQVQQPTFVQPREIPKEVPKITPVATTTADVKPSEAEDTAQTPSDQGGVAGGVMGGVAGGVQGGTVGGEVGGQLGGQLGGVQGGTLGGKVGGTGTGTEGEGTGSAAAPAPPPPPPPPPAPEPKDEGPLRVGGDVKAPVAISRKEPNYTDTARKGHVTGVVIVEAVIDKSGNVDRVKVLKGLPMGLSEQAVDAVKSWRFKPGTLNGEPVDVIFTLTVNFTLDGAK
jgi:protein TonB